MQYSDFTDTLAFRLNRDDATLAMLQYATSLGKIRIERTLRIPAMEAFMDSEPVLQTVTNPADLSQTTGTWITQVAIPNNFLAVQYMTADGNTLTPIPWNRFSRMAFPQIGCPKYFSRIGGIYYIMPFALYTTRMIYYASFPQLVLPTDANYLTDSATECLIFAALSILGDMFRMDETPNWDARCDAEIARLNLQGQDADTSGGPMVIEGVYGESTHFGSGFGYGGWYNS